MDKLAATSFDQFARFYDDDYRDYDDDLGAILELAEQQGGDVVELGCGTGRVMLPLLAAGHRVTGIDVSQGLLDVARRKVAAAGLSGKATWIQADLTSVHLPAQSYSFAVCTSNTLMHFTTPDSQQRVLHMARAALKPGGLLFLDLFNPDVARLIEVQGVQELADRWVDERTGAQVIKWSVRSVDFAEQLQETLFIYEEILVSGEVRRTVCPFTVRFLWRNEGELMLREAGFEVEEVWGDHYGTPYDSQADHIIFLARRTDRIAHDERRT